jgi:hypothetical protein
VAAIAIALLAGSVFHGFAFPDLARFLAYASLACIASTMKVRLPGLQASISVNFVFILMAITSLTLAETLILAIPATIVQCLWRPKTRPKAMQVLFNASTVVIAATFSYWIAHLIPGGPDTIAALAPAATVYFVTNTGMVAMVISLVSNERPAAKWARCHLWTFPYYLAGCAIAALVAHSSRTSGWRLSLLVLPLLYLIYSYYLGYVSPHRALSTDSPA